MEKTERTEVIVSALMGSKFDAALSEHDNNTLNLYFYQDPNSAFTTNIQMWCIDKKGLEGMIRVLQRELAKME